jgi:hypothetical protein
MSKWQSDRYSHNRFQINNLCKSWSLLCRILFTGREKHEKHLCPTLVNRRTNWETWAKIDCKARFPFYNGFFACPTIPTPAGTKHATEDLHATASFEALETCSLISKEINLAFQVAAPAFPGTP